MNLVAFEAERGADWDELEAAVRRSGGRAERLGAEGVLRLGTLYRRAAADLAYARRRFGGDPLTARLESLVTRARATVYATQPRRDTLRSFVATGYWRRVAERPLALLVAWVLLLAPAGAGFAWALSDPGAALGVVPAGLQAAAQPPAEGRDFTAGEGAAFSSQVLTNNIQVAFVAFALGLTLGLGTAALVIFNGLTLGAIAGVAIGAGNGAALAKLLSAHGPLELTCIVVAAAAGLRIGWAIVAPGPRARGVALLAEARASVEVVLGTAAWLVVAGLCEGFLTGPGLSTAVQGAIGLALFCLFWGLVLWRGRLAVPTAAPAPSP